MQNAKCLSAAVVRSNGLWYARPPPSPSLVGRSLSHSKKKKSEREKRNGKERMMLLCWRLDSASMESNLQMLCCQSIIKLEFSFVDWHTHTQAYTHRHIHMQTLAEFSLSLAYLVGKTQRAAVARERFAVLQCEAANPAFHICI